MTLRTLRALHLGADAVLVSLAWLAAYGLRAALAEPLGRPINPFGWYLTALPLAVLPWLACCWWFGIYKSARGAGAADAVSKLLRGAALGLLVLASTAFFVKELDVGRSVVLTAAALNLLVQGASRALFHRFELGLRRAGAGEQRVLVVGTGVTAIRLLQKLQDHPDEGFAVVGLLHHAASGEEMPEKLAGLPVLGRVDQVRRVAEEHRVEEVFVAEPALGHGRMLELVLDCEDLGLTFRVVTNLFEVLTAGTQLELIDDLPLVRLGRERVHPLYEPAKRALDVVGAGLGLVLGAPLLVWVGWRLWRAGTPPLFVHERVGRHGRRFRMLKLRTMAPETGHYEVAPRGGDDPRITPYGAWLRVTSIDELPQLWNVLRGEMSLVGPRPEMPFIVDQYDEWQRRRLTVKPGITGLWQILGRKDLPMHENLQYDFYYIRNRSLALDLSILLRTVGAVWSRRGAF